MCILLCYNHTSNDEDIGYELILLSNRDEEFHRPSLAAHVWPETNYVLGGQDITPSREGGTWLGFNTQGRIGVLLNLPKSTDNESDNKKSRGFIVPNYVNNMSVGLDYYMKNLDDTKMNYNGFSFIGFEKNLLLDGWRVVYTNNASNLSIPVDVRSKFFVLSNHQYGNEYEFCKTQHGCQLLDNTLKELTNNYKTKITDEKQLVDRLMMVLNDQTTFCDDKNMGIVYPEIANDISLYLSAICVRMPLTGKKSTYGTRTHTIILVRSNHTGLYLEKNIENPLENEMVWDEKRWEFRLGCSEPPTLLK